MSLEEKIQQFPTSPGVYLMRDAAGEIIYVGKARSLRQRVRSYFNPSGDSRYHVKFLMAKVADIEVVLTDTEKEALLLENTLIKQHHPRYNLNLKDDKTYFSLRLDPHEEFPRFTVVRKRPDDGARYFGPYSSGFGGPGGAPADDPDVSAAALSACHLHVPHAPLPVPPDRPVQRPLPWPDNAGSLCGSG